MAEPVWDKASDYLIQQYKESESVVSVVDMHELRFKNIATSLLSMAGELLDTAIAEGEQLNNIGKTIDAGRGTFTDEEYRLWIEFIQGVNAAGGEPEIIIEYIKKYCGTYFSSLLFDDGSASVNLQLTTSGTLPEGFLEELVYQLSRAVPAAVEVRLFHSETGEVFAVEDEGTDVSIGYGFSEEVNEIPTYVFRISGGQFVDPISI